MFTIIISEKGGAERRETFDKNEINVGRVQGNDLMLPKGNVSKHHARLLYRDGRFIVTDLKSTNGTYVNGRKIAQATIVREGDKIYIGDFVLKLDTGSGASSAPSAPEQEYRPPPEQPRMQLPGPQTSPPPIQPAPVHMAAQGQMPSQPLGMPPVPPPLVQPSRDVSHYPLERDPDESESSPNHGPAPGKMPPAPRVPSMQ
jgi:pilus assembly protein CpaF